MMKVIDGHLQPLFIDFDVHDHTKGLGSTGDESVALVLGQNADDKKFLKENCKGISCDLAEFQNRSDICWARDAWNYEKFEDRNALLDAHAVLPCGAHAANNAFKNVLEVHPRLCLQADLCMGIWGRPKDSPNS